MGCLTIYWNFWDSITLIIVTYLRTTKFLSACVDPWKCMITSQNIIQIRRLSVWDHLSSYIFYRSRPLYNRLDFDIHRWIGFHDKVLNQVHTQYQSIVKKFHIFYEGMTDPQSCNNLASSLCDIDTRHQRNNSVKFITDHRGNSVFRMIWWSFDTYITRICYFHFITFFKKDRNSQQYNVHSRV